jgi:hypothetical protein
MLITGAKVGRLTLVEAIAGIGKQRSPHAFVCRCDCGVLKTLTVHDLNKTRSCGCWKRERMRAMTLSHDGSRKPEYGIWHGMKDRCSNPNNIAFKSYGGRGITVCDRWRTSFANFLADMGPRPSFNHSIERRDNDIGYEPANCSWQESHVQSRNRRSTRHVLAFGKTQCISDWAVEYGLTVACLFARLRKGLSIEDALTIPLNDCAAIQAAKH